jgi:DNA-binding transcriptional LysR family regulator
MELRELTAFVAVAEEGGVSAASRRLHISQPALSQTVSSLERELGLKLLERSSTGVRTTDAGAVLLAEARAILARHDQALQAMAQFSCDGGGVIRLGVPLELPSGVLPRALAKFAGQHPQTRIAPRHLSTARQLEALRSGELDLALVRERPAGREFDAMLVVRENLGVLLASEVADRVVSAYGVRLDALCELKWVGFDRSGSPAWYDELTAILRSHGLDVGAPPAGDQELIADVKFAAVTAGHAFALAPENWDQPLPDGITWSSLVGHPLVRRTWLVWSANSRRRELAHLVTAFEVPA